MEIAATPPPTSMDNHRTLSGGQIWLKATGLALLLALGLVLLTFLIGAGFIYARVQTFAETAGVTTAELRQVLKSGYNQTPLADGGHKNILVLGLDSLDNRGNSAPLTDTMLLASIDLNSGRVSTLPLPRDLWLAEYQTKINALYYYGSERNPENPAEFPTQVLADMTQLPIHHTLIVSLEQVATVIDLMGGIEVNVEQSFVDEQFPRSDVDIQRVTDPNILYERVEFEKGKQIMDGETAIKYMRSRHGNNDQNTDTARSARQQAIIEATISRLSQRDQLFNPQLMGELYGYYLDNFSTSLSPEEIIATGKQLYSHRSRFKIEGHSLSIAPEDEAGSITHPPQSLFNGQWVYTIVDAAQFAKEARQKLY